VQCLGRTRGGDLIRAYHSFGRLEALPGQVAQMVEGREMGRRGDVGQREIEKGRWRASASSR
jgi:hypothetical protein